MIRRRVANPSPAALAIINPKKGGRMAIRKSRKARKARPRKAAVTHRPARATFKRRSNPSRRTRRGSVVARSRRYGRRRNPSGKLLPLVIGAGISQIGASLIPFGGGPFIEAAKVAGVGWLLERFLGRTVPSVFGEAKEGGMIAGGVLLFNAYLAPTLAGAVRSVMPGGAAKSNGVSGIGRGVGDLVTLPAGNYDPYYGTTPMISAPASGAQPVRGSQKAETLKGLLTMPAMPGAAYMR